MIIHPAGSWVIFWQVAEGLLLMCPLGASMRYSNEQNNNNTIAAVPFVSGSCLAQEENFQQKHSLAINIGHEHSFHGLETNGGSKNLVLPYWGFDYDFQFARKFAVGVHINYVNEEFEIEKNLESGKQEVTRTRPVAPAAGTFVWLAEGLDGKVMLLKEGVLLS